MTRRIVHLVSHYLPRSETFTYELLRHVPGFEHHVLTTRVENLDLFPWPQLTVAKSEDEYTDHVRRIEPAAIVCHFGPTGVAGLAPGLACDVPVITIFHGYDVSMLLRDPAWIERYRALFQFGAHAICISREGRRRLRAIGAPAARVTALHLGVDITRFAFQPRRPRRAGDPFRLLSVARLAEKKGLPVLISAVSLARSRGADVHLTIIGEGPLRDALLRQRQDLGLNEAITFAGARDHADVQDALAHCDAFALTSITAADGDQEGIPVVLMEAMASGVPVIASRHSGIPELITHQAHGLLAGEGNVAGVAEAIERYAHDADFTAQMAAAARARIEADFNIVRQGRKFARALEQVTRVHRHAAKPATTAATGQRMLFVRCLPQPAALSKIAVLKHRYPSARLSVLTRADQREAFDQCPLVDEVLPYPPGRMEMNTLPQATIDALRHGEFETILMPLAGDPLGYDNVLRIASACNPRRIIGLTRDNQEVALSAPVGGQAS